MDNNNLQQILEKGGEISYKTYLLIFEENPNNNPDLCWEGYTIFKKDEHSFYRSIHRSLSLDEILGNFLEIIDTDIRNEYYANGKK